MTSSPEASEKSVPPVIVSVPGLSEALGTSEIWIQLELVGDAGLPDELARWDRQSGRIAGWYEKTRTATSELGSNDEAELELARSGRYAVRIWFVAGTKGSLSPGEVRVDVRPGEESPRVVVEVSSEQAQAALSGLGSGGR